MGNINQTNKPLNIDKINHLISKGLLSQAYSKCQKHIKQNKVINPQAYMLMAEMYKCTRIFNLTQIKEFYLNACYLGHTPAYLEYALASFYDADAYSNLFCKQRFQIAKYQNFSTPFYKSNKLDEKKNYCSSWTYFNLALKIDPKNPIINYYIGLHYDRGYFIPKNYKTAISYYKFAYQKGCKYAILNIVDIYTKSTDFDIRSGDFDQYLFDCYNIYGAHIYSIKAYEKLGYYETAINQCLELLSKYENYTNIHIIEKVNYYQADINICDGFNKYKNHFKDDPMIYLTDNMEKNDILHKLNQLNIITDKSKIK